MKKLVLAVIASCFCISANAACDTKSLKGDYFAQVTYTGYNGAYPTTCGNLGIIKFDGKGTATAVGFDSCAGQTTQTPTLTGAYSVDALCSGGITFGSGVTIRFVFDKAFKAGALVGDNAANKASGIGTLTRQ